MKQHEYQGVNDRGTLCYISKYIIMWSLICKLYVGFTHVVVDLLAVRWTFITKL